MIPFPTISSYARSRTILADLTKFQGSVLDLYQPGSITKVDNVTQLRYTGIIRELKLTANIKSYSPAIIPAIRAGMTTTEKLLLSQQAEAQTERCLLHIWGNLSNSSVDTKLFSLTLTNQTPYYQVNLLPYFSANTEYLVAPDFLLRYSLENIGYGLLDDDRDSVVIFGSVREEMDVIPETSMLATVSRNFTATITTSPTRIVAARSDRKGLVLVNSSNTDVSISRGTSDVRIDSGIFLAANGGTYEIDYTNLYQGDIWAVCRTGTVSIPGNESW